MALAQQILKLLEQVTREEIEALSPVERERLAQLLKHWAAIAERGDPPSGVLKALKDRDGDG